MRGRRWTSPPARCCTARATCRTARSPARTPSTSTSSTPRAGTGSTAATPTSGRRPEREELRPVLVQPIALRAPLGPPGLDEPPEAARVVRLAQMAELVHDDVVEHVERREHAPPVEREPAARRARPPARTLVADLDPVELDPQNGRLLLCE